MPFYAKTRAPTIFALIEFAWLELMRLVKIKRRGVASLQ
jgi:hypothetical protein